MPSAADESGRCPAAGDESRSAANSTMFSSSVSTEADEFYASAPARARTSPTTRSASSGRRLPGMLWTKQCYHYDVRMAGWRSRPAPAAAATQEGPQSSTGHTCTTPTSFPCRTSGNIRGSLRGIWRFTAWRWPLIDPEFAKNQLILLLREWYMHPNGQIARL